jgi:hypothetical protein
VVGAAGAGLLQAAPTSASMASPRAPNNPRWVALAIKERGDVEVGRLT